MDVREKLVELLSEIIDGGFKWHNYLYESGEQLNNDEIASFLVTNGVTVQEWVDVKDRLPEESGMYIVTANDGHAQRVSFVQWQKKNRMWNLTGARSYWRVTHWMPMPQPPKGE